MRDRVPFIRAGMCRHLRMRMDQFWKDETGSTVEFVVLLPAHFLLLGFSFMTGMTLLSIGQSWDVARDVARRAALGELTDIEAVRMVEASLPASLNPVAVIEPDPTDVRMSITIMPDFRVAGFLRQLMPDGYTLTYIMRRETGALVQ
ncbi:MAG: hypothetical protein ACXIUW_07295 [Roseinatronobacter sp.]